MEEVLPCCSHGFTAAEAVAPAVGSKRQLANSGVIERHTDAPKIDAGVKLGHRVVSGVEQRPVVHVRVLNIQTKQDMFGSWE